LKAFLWDPWRTAKAQPERKAIYVNDRCCTFGELIDQVEHFRRGIGALGLKDGSVLGTDLPPGPEFFALTLAALRDGYGLFAVSRDWSIRSALLAQAGAVVDITDESCQPNHIPCLSPGELHIVGAAPASQTRLPRNGGARSGYLVFVTSGTTGQPKVVVRSRPWYSYRGVAVMPKYAAGPGNGPHIMAFPAFHLGTIGPALYALQAGSGVVVQHSWTAAGFRDLVDRHAADSAYVTTRQLPDLARDAITPRYPIKVMFTGGSSVGREVKRAVIEVFGPVVHEFYGTSKGIISEVSAAEWLRRQGTVGRPLRGVHAIIRTCDYECCADEIGNIWVQYRTIDRGESSPAYEDTGDLGYMDEDGYLFVVARTSPNEDSKLGLLEHLIRTLPGVTDAATSIASGQEFITCYVEHSQDFATELTLQIENLARSLGIPRPNIVTGAPGHFPRTPSGKLWRAQLDSPQDVS